MSKENGKVKKILGNQIAVVTLILAALFIFFSINAKGFFAVYNFKSILQQTAVVGIITVAQAYVIITAGIDLSQGAIIGLVTVVSAGLIVDNGQPVWLAIIVGILVGTAIGAINGILVAFLGLPAFIATLGTKYVFEAIALLMKGGNDIYNLPSQIAEFGRGTIGGWLPNLAIIMLIVAVVMHVVVHRTSFGRCVYACGSNLPAARFSGVKTKKVIFLVYLIAGFLCGVAGIVMMCRINAGIAVSGKGYEMNAVCGVVIGGGSLSGGKGSILGAIVGAFIMTVLSSGLQIMGFSTYWQNLITGIVLVIAVMIDTFRHMKNQGVA
ncbi:MAG: ABC transporter permease [Blautia sp.]